MMNSDPFKMRDIEPWALALNLNHWMGPHLPAHHHPGSWQKQIQILRWGNYCRICFTPLLWKDTRSSEGAPATLQLGWIKYKKQNTVMHYWAHKGIKEIPKVGRGGRGGREERKQREGKERERIPQGKCPKTKGNTHCKWGKRKNPNRFNTFRLQILESSGPECPTTWDVWRMWRIGDRMKHKQGVRNHWKLCFEVEGLSQPKM